ncbi:MAG: T9SS type A sorting domain-containing protein, partial [Chitinophagales bacterium]
NQHGMVYLKNGALLEYAKLGITTKKHINGTCGFDSNYFGGIVIADNAIFKDNNRAVEFMRFNQPNISRFINETLFEYTRDDLVNTNANIDANSFKFITMWAVKDILFEKCIFKRTALLFDIHGIYSLGASYTIRESSFDNLERGVQAGNSSTIGDESITIGGLNDTEGNSFYNCQEAIKIYGVNNLYAAHNTCTNTNPPELVGIFPIDIRNTESYEIFNNDINGGTFGIWTTENGSGANFIHCNRFSNIAYDNIRTQDDNSGLKILNNEFTDGTTCINVTVSDLQSTGAIHPFQGNEFFSQQNPQVDDPAGNYFTPSICDDTNPTSSEHIQTFSSSSFQYLFHNNDFPRYEPTCDLGANYEKEGLFVDANTECFPLKAIEDIDGGDDIVGDGITPPNIQICSGKICLDQILELIEEYIHLIDGNDTDGLIENIQDRPVSTLTYQALKAASPFLSDKVLTEIVHQVNMPIIWVEELLMEHVPLSRTVQTALNQRIPPLPSTVLHNLDQVSLGKQFSDRKRIELWILGLEFKRKQLLQQLLNGHFKNNEMDLAIALLEGEETVKADKHLTKLYIQKEDFTAATNKLTQIPDNGLVNSQFKQIQELNIFLKSNGKEYCEITPEDASMLEAIASSQNSNSNYAKAILHEAYGTEFEVQMPDNFDGVQKSQALNTSFYVQNSLETLQLIPNPSTHSTIAYFEEKADRLLIQDITGKIVFDTVVEKDQAKVFINTSTLENGIYIVSLSWQGKPKAKNKLVVLH